MIHGMTSSLYAFVTPNLASRCEHPGARPSSIRLNEEREPGEKDEPGVRSLRPLPAYFVNKFLMTESAKIVSKILSRLS